MLYLGWSFLGTNNEILLDVVGRAYSPEWALDTIGTLN
jgi:hypothetical protein